MTTSIYTTKAILTKSFSNLNSDEISKATKTGQIWNVHFCIVLYGYGFTTLQWLPLLTHSYAYQPFDHVYQN